MLNSEAANRKPERSTQMEVQGAIVSKYLISKSVTSALLPGDVLRVTLYMSPYSLCSDSRTVSQQRAFCLEQQAAPSLVQRLLH